MHNYRCIGFALDIPAIIALPDGVSPVALATGVAQDIRTSRDQGMHYTSDTPVIFEQIDAGQESQVYCLPAGTGIVAFARDGTSVRATFTGAVCRIALLSIDALRKKSEEQ